MVRVISVHHFSKQNIQVVEQPTASTTAPPNRLLLALQTHCIEVRDLSAQGALLLSFPSVDEVKQIVHCINGNYIGTVERKMSRKNHDTYYARIYTNWDNVATMQQSKMTRSGISLGLCESGMVQPMRARIAGRVTPTINHAEWGTLEMIELPTQHRPDNITCCQVSGNVLLQSSNFLTIYKFCVRTHDISKQRFIDFEELPILLELSFWPSYISMCENYIACMNRTSIHVFTISQNTQNEGAEESKGKTNSYMLYSKCEEGPINYEQILEKEQICNNVSVSVNLASVSKENSTIHKQCPFTCYDFDMNVNIKSNSLSENWNDTYKINHLLQLKLKPVLIEGAHRQISEEFKCLLLKPLYVSYNQKSKKTESHRKLFLKSDYSYCLNSVACILATQQEGYLYVFNDTAKQDVDNCVAVYPFTAPVYKVLLEDYTLHALTETGLESYTLRIAHQLIRNIYKINNIAMACPSVNESVCLIGLRPFVHVQEFLLSENYLVLLTNSDSVSFGRSDSTNSTNWTLYNLELPEAYALYNDFLSLAKVHQYSSPQTYCHLINEAHMILRMKTTVLQWKNELESAVFVNLPFKETNENILELYKESCTLLGDYYITCEEESDYKLCLPYYKMAHISPIDVLQRVKHTPAMSQIVPRGLLFYLKTVLLQIKTWTEADVLFTLLGEQNFIDTVLDLFSKYDPDSLSIIILKNNVLREYATDKLINMCVQNKFRDESNVIALSVLYLQRYMQAEATAILESLSTESLKTLLICNWELLFDTSCSKTKDDRSSFSDLSGILMQTNPEVLADVLTYLIIDLKAINLQKVLNTFLEFLPSHINKEGSNGNLILQLLLEKYFKKYFSMPENVYKKTNYDGPTCEALNLLIRTYLSQLQVWQVNSKEKFEKLTENTYAERVFRSSFYESEFYSMKSILALEDIEKDTIIEDKHYKLLRKNKNKKYEDENEDYLFSKIRWTYLQIMPPFNNCDFGSYTFNETSEIKYAPETNHILKKLQALFCSQLIPKQIINEMLVFCKTNANFKGSLSLLSIILPIPDATLLLLERCPICILQYAKDRYTKDDEWANLIVLLQEKITYCKRNDGRQHYSTYVASLQGVLVHLATLFPVQRLQQILPTKLEEKTIDQFSLPVIVNKPSYKLQPVILDKSKVMETESLSGENITYSFNYYNQTQLDLYNYEPYILLCKQIAHANHIKRLIVATGQKLLTTLNL